MGNKGLLQSNPEEYASAPMQSTSSPTTATPLSPTGRNSFGQNNSNNIQLQLRRRMSGFPFLKPLLPLMHNFDFLKRFIQYLSGADIAKLGAVSHKFYEIINVNDQVWQVAFETHFGFPIQKLQELQPQQEANEQQQRQQQLDHPNAPVHKKQASNPFLMDEEELIAGNTGGGVSKTTFLNFLRGITLGITAQQLHSVSAYVHIYNHGFTSVVA